MRENNWEAFRDSGLLWWVNRILHTFGWAIIFIYEDDELVDVYPDMVDYNGFSEEAEEKGFKKIKQHFIKD